MRTPVQRYRGHVNSTRNFIRATFGPGHRLVCAGSEDGLVYMWDVDTAQIVARLEGHAGVVYACEWNEERGVLVSGSEDGALLSWVSQDQHRRLP